MPKYLVQIDLHFEAETMEYLEEKCAELEEVISLHFEEATLVGFNADVFEGEEESDRLVEEDALSEGELEEYDEYDDEEEDDYDEDDER
jgi:hypothetical protein